MEHLTQISAQEAAARLSRANTHISRYSVVRIGDRFEVVATEYAGLLDRVADYNRGKRVR